MPGDVVHLKTAMRRREAEADIAADVVSPGAVKLARTALRWLDRRTGLPREGAPAWLFALLGAVGDGRMPDPATRRQLILSLAAIARTTPGTRIEALEAWGFAPAEWEAEVGILMSSGEAFEVLGDMLGSTVGPHDGVTRDVLADALRVWASDQLRRVARILARYELYFLDEAARGRRGGAREGHARDDRPARS